MKDGRSVLLIDSDAADAMQLQEIFQMLGVSAPILHYTDSTEALAYLTEADSVKPCLILLHLNASGLPIADFLRAVKADEEVGMLPVVVLADQRQEQCVDACFALGVAGYMIKSEQYERLIRDLHVIIQYWSLSRLPSKLEFVSLD